MSPRRLSAPVVLAAAFPILALAGVHGTGNDATPDTTAARYALQEVVVTATRTGAFLRSLPSAATILTTADIGRAPGTMLGAALAGAPGAFLRTYGGGMQVQTLSLRGLPVEQTLVLVDGQRLNSFQNSQTDLGIFSAAGIDRVELVRGGFSSLYGADAVGGVLSISTRRTPERWTAGIRTTAGSNSLSAGVIEAGGRSGIVGWRALARRESARGDYRFDFNNGTTSTPLRRNGSDYRSTGTDLRVDVAPSEAMAAWLSLRYADTDRGSPGPVTDVQSVGRARLSDRSLWSQTGAEWTIATEWVASLRGLLQSGRESYADPGILIGGTASRSSSVNRSYQISPEIRFTPSAATTVTAGVDLAHGWLTGTETREASRWQNSVFLSASHTVNLPWETPFELVVFPSVRYDRFSDVASDVSPRVGLNLGLLRNPDLRLRGSYGKSFRVPTFNELYWTAGGNPNLSPERSLSADAGLLAGVPLLGTLTAEVTIFTVETTNRIIWLPATGSYWSPRNIGRVRSDGFEAELRWATLEGALLLTANSTWTTVTKRSADAPGDPTEGKRLIYTPAQTVHLSATFVAGDAELYLLHSWTSYRYTTEMNDRFLPSFGVTSATVRWGFRAAGFRISLKGEVENIFNVSYQTMALFPMPLREFRGTVGVEL